MSGSGLLLRNNVMAWLILGYLCSHPEAKDTAEGVRRWWLLAEGIEADRDRVRVALDYLVTWGWLLRTTSYSGLAVYGLNKERLPSLQWFLQGQPIHH